MAKTYRLDTIDLANDAAKLTVVCVADAYVAGAQANIVLFLHGTSEASIESFLGRRNPDCDLRNVLDSTPTGKQTILIAPTLSKEEARGGKLGGDDSDSVPSGALKWFFQLVAAELQKLTPKPPIADFRDPGKIGKIVLAAHSGGGKVMLALARTKPKKDEKSPDPYAEKIAECWGFDCLYGHPAGALSIPTPVPGPKASPDEWTTWETKHAQHRETLWRDWLRSSGVEFHLFCATGAQGGGTTTRSRNLDALASRDHLSNVHITYDPNASHHGIILPRFTDRLKLL